MSIFTAIVDSREKKPLVLTDAKGQSIPKKIKKLDTGDYSIAGLEKLVAIERKSIEDLIACIGRDRQRFEREIQRLLAYPTRAIIVEASWRDIEYGQYRSKVTPQAAMASLLGWIARGIPVIMADTHERAGHYVSRMLEITARRRFDEMKNFREMSA